MYNDYNLIDHVITVTITNIKSIQAEFCGQQIEVDRSREMTDYKLVPVGKVKTVGGYPDDSEHTVEWLCKYKDLADGDYLYAALPVEQPVPAVDQLVEALERIVMWPDGGNQCGQANIKGFASEVLAALHNDPLIRGR